MEHKTYLLDQLFQIVRPRVTHDGVLYLFASDIDDAAEIVLQLKEPTKLLVPTARKRALKTVKGEESARNIARAILRLNDIKPTIDTFRKEEKYTTRWKIGPFVPEYHSRYVWPEAGFDKRVPLSNQPMPPVNLT